MLTTNGGHWSIENSYHYIIDWNYHEDRSRIRTRPWPGKYHALTSLGH
ncbi:MAG: hypothetical protein JRH18_02055 [Deltaproteobacteria bacterium]|nr:hypothetical protein [Deltaproteobacteria bacterium]MBW2150430.1 hypothetical protein [Deltaproteobacteria bacterium]